MVYLRNVFFEALSWDVDWTAPASSNYGINAAWQHGK